MPFRHPGEVEEKVSMAALDVKSKQHILKKPLSIPANQRARGVMRSVMRWW
jgi:hypothetical protein